MKHKVTSIILSLLLLAGCSTQKTKWANVTYHNTTCHYNVWWNGNESLKAGVRQLEDQNIDDYTQILPVYKLGTKEQAMGVFSQMDRAIEKGVKGISKHSIYQHGKEYVSYVKNCYLLTAYATFYKQDFPATDNTCRLVISQYSGSVEADEARILMARSQTMQKMYVDAETALDRMVNEYGNGDFSPKLVDKLYLAMVECVLPQEKYKKAVQYIRLALDETHDNAVRARLYYIMAQIYQKLEKRPTATKYFEKVLACHPDYVMEFNAKINIASCSDLEHTDVAAQEKMLDKMLNDKKNEEFKDQIYYAKGEMYLGMKDVQKACDSYKLSVEAAQNNPPQKAKSALRMADVLYDVYENYDMAQSYYDTAIHIIDNEYPNYDEIRDRHTLLTSLVEYTRLVERNDSLFALADMSPAEREAKIKKQIEELKQREAAEREKKLLDELAADAKAQGNTLQGDWYFYNHNTVEKGKQSFRQRWGNRMLEDYWFLTQKSMISMGNLLGGFADNLEEEEGEEADSTDVKPQAGPKDDPNDPHCVAYYLKDMPTTMGQRDTMHNQIATCLLNAGYIYYDGIKNTDKALECYLRMANDYSDNEDIVQAFYQLFRIYSKQGNTPSANYYRDMVLMGFPDCDYANLIRDENYYLELIRRTELAKEEYRQIYSLYRRHRYGDVLSRTQKAVEDYADEPDMVGRFLFWNSLALAQTGSKDSAIATLRQIVTHNADTAQITLLAQNQLDYFLDEKHEADSVAAADEEINAMDEARAKGGRYGSKADKVGSSTTTATAIEDELPAESMVFRYRESMQHYVLVLVNDKKIVATQLQYRIADFNSENYANAGYRCSPLMFTDSTQMVTIHRFKDADEAMLYYTHLLLPEGPLAQYDPKDYVVFAISTQNYTTFYNRKNIDAYAAFFEKYYKR